ncbi:RNA polymerase I associated factor, A49-like protein [Scenedesmus sp. NREL 46B-D3]|nr:RNA polymerase I associated factor, A49-like protein [Scenedesmus sp. NREL 46B-D3]
MYLTSRLPGANLIATTELPVQSAADKAHYVVGIRNKRTGRLRLSEAAGGIVLRLEAQAAHVADADVAGVIKAAQQQQGQQGQLPQDVAARRLMARRLVEAFGSTRRKRQMKQREEGAVVVTRNADEDRLGLLLGEVAARATAAGETRSEVMGRLGVARNIPVHNPSATQPHLAYKISAMFPDHMLAAINSGQILHAAEKQEDRERMAEKKQVPEYVLSRLQRVSDEADPRKRRRLAKLLALLAALLQLATARNRLPLRAPREAKEEGGAARPGGLAELCWGVGIRRVEVLEPLLDMFYSRTAEEGGTVYVREDFKRQLLLMHVLVVALDVEGWALAPAQFDGLRKELKMTAADVVARFRELGCICKAAKLPTGIAPDGTPSAALSSYSVTLLPGGAANTKTLEQSFPRAKTGAKQRGGR